MKRHRIKRINSLLLEVLSEVLRREVKNRHIHEMTTLTRVDTTGDLRQAKVYVSIMASPENQQRTLEALNSAGGFLAVQASKLVSLRYFPSLLFEIDRSAEDLILMDQLLKKVLPEQDL